MQDIWDLYGPKERETKNTGEKLVVWNRGQLQLMSMIEDSARWWLSWCTVGKKDFLESPRGVFGGGGGGGRPPNRYLLNAA